MLNFLFSKISLRTKTFYNNNIGRYVKIHRSLKRNKINQNQNLFYYTAINIPTNTQLYN